MFLNLNYSTVITWRKILNISIYVQQNISVNIDYIFYELIYI